MNFLKVQICDDSLVYRALLKQLLKKIPSVQITATANDGKSLLRSIHEDCPDVVLLDVEMPVMDGITVMRELHNTPYRPSVIMCSAFTTEGADVTIEALELGAYDFITKPEGKDRKESEQKLLAQLEPQFSSLLKKKINKEATQEVFIRASAPSLPKTNTKTDLVCIGISTGGPNALMKVIPELPTNLPVPVAIVQHMPPLFLTSLAASLNKKCSIAVKVAEDNEELKAGCVYFAPGQTQMGIFQHGGALFVRFDGGAPAANHCTPAADYLFRSAAEVLKDKVLGIVMTGMGADGARGLKLLHDAGAMTMAQDQSSSTIYGMPKEAVRFGGAKMTVALMDIAQKITSVV